jgi:ferredoxin
MRDVEISFGEGREGLVPIGTYLIDAARRMGAASSFDCDEDAGHACEITITEGVDLLSPISKSEKQQLSKEALRQGTRLACFAKFEKPGVATAMVNKKKETAKDEAAKEAAEEAYRKEFAGLPLEKKIAELVQLEAIALGETFAFVINSPFKVFEKIGDVMAEFGFKKEEEQKRRARPVDAPVTEAGSTEPKNQPSAEKDHTAGETI